MLIAFFTLIIWEFRSVFKHFRPFGLRSVKNTCQNNGRQNNLFEIINNKQTRLLKVLGIMVSALQETNATPARYIRKIWTKH